METTLLRELRRIQRLSVEELRAEWMKLHDGETCRSGNREYMVKRLCWRLQEIRYGGLSDAAKSRLEELSNDGIGRASTPRLTRVAAAPAPVETAPRRVRDLRLPVAGSVITKTYKGRELRVVVREDSYEYDGAMFGSLSALARKITGSTHINGKLFFNLVTRKR